MNRVAVTGLGIVSSLGTSLENNWLALSKGVSGISLLEDSPYDLRSNDIKVAAYPRDFKAEHWLDRQTIRRYDPFIHFALVSSQLAIQHSCLSLDTIDRCEFGVCIGSGIGGIGTIEENVKNYWSNSKHRISPFYVAGSIINMASGLVSIEHGLKGPNLSTVSACTSGAHAIAVGSRMIQTGETQRMLVGGSEFPLTNTGIGGFHASRALSLCTNPQQASRPWDKQRDGFVIAAGAASLVLENWDLAIQRKATIYAELVGIGMSADAFHVTQPSECGDGAKRCMRKALKDGHLQPVQIGYINAHGTSTPVGDVVEAQAIQSVFKDCRSLKVSSTKSMTGHALGAAGAIEAVYSILALQHQFIPPTINLNDVEEGCEALDLTANMGSDHHFQYAMSNSFGFGGANCSLIFKKV